MGAAHSGFWRCAPGSDDILLRYRLCNGVGTGNPPVGHRNDTESIEAEWAELILFVITVGVIDFQLRMFPVVRNWPGHTNARDEPLKPIRHYRNQAG